MVSLLNITVIGILLFVIVITQAKPLLETSNDVEEIKSPISNQQLYEIYKSMRADPRFASASNHDIVSYIYRNLVLGNGDDNDLVKTKYQYQRRHRYQKANQAE